MWLSNPTLLFLRWLCFFPSFGPCVVVDSQLLNSLHDVSDQYIAPRTYSLARPT
jgi:hypothetical protein